jgi:hypothetical protein
VAIVEAQVRRPSHDTDTLVCPKCGPEHRDVSITCLGVTLTDGMFDDVNRAHCHRCGAKAIAGVWQRLEVARKATWRKVVSIDGSGDLRYADAVAYAMIDAFTLEGGGKRYVFDEERGAWRDDRGAYGHCFTRFPIGSVPTHG